MGGSSRGSRRSVNCSHDVLSGGVAPDWCMSRCVVLELTLLSLMGSSPVPYGDCSSVVADRMCGKLYRESSFSIFGSGGPHFSPRQYIQMSRRLSRSCCTHSGSMQLPCGPQCPYCRNQCAVV